MKSATKYFPHSLLLAFFALLISVASQAATVDTVNTYSPSMKKSIKAVIIIPEAARANERFPVLYLLHGYSGNYADWIRKVPSVTQLADQYRMIIVCPDGGFSSWYFDSPVDSSIRYETYIIHELIPFIDQHYATRPTASGRGITGLSMGGHGALYLAFRHNDIFGAAGSMSGGVDLRPFPGNWDLAKRLGSYPDHQENWEKHSVVNLVYRISAQHPEIIMDCGSSDFFQAVNQELHEELLLRNIPHDYISRPGSHNWEYWENALPYQVLFMHRFFSKANKNAY